MSLNFPQNFYSVICNAMRQACHLKRTEEDLLSNEYYVISVGPKSVQSAIVHLCGSVADKAKQDVIWLINPNAVLACGMPCIKCPGVIRGCFSLPTR